MARTQQKARVLIAGGLLLAAASSLCHAQDISCIVGDCPGLDVTLNYTADLRRNASGGLERGNAASGLLHTGVAWTSDRLWPGAMVVTSASLIHTTGGDISGRYVGDLQGLNNIEADGAVRLYDFWTEIRFGQGLATRVGFLDLNAEFDEPVTSSFFVGPPFGIGTDLAQTGENGPAVFPITSLGIRLEGRFGERTKWRMAAFDGVPGSSNPRDFATVDISRRQGALLIGELEHAPRGFNKVALGAWSYTSRFERFDAAASGDVALRKGNRGAYAVADRPMGAIGGVRFDGMVRAGYATGKFNATDRYLGAAVVASRLWERRPDDAIGLAVAHARTSSAFQRQLAADGGVPRTSETQVELTWRAPLSDWAAVVPGAQWVNRPGADRGVKDAFVVGLRFEFALEHTWPMVVRTEGAGSDSPVVMTSP
ncbi:MAG: carbohydrate porin [Proteobacteria bacterium]|nr:carbohydrate porin [Pseudomonadota bacterium]